MSADSEAMKQGMVSYPAGLPQILKLSDVEFARELLLLAAAKLYEMGRLSSGKAARLAGLDRVGFLHELGRLGVPAINLREEEAEAEILAARDLRSGQVSRPLAKGRSERTDRRVIPLQARE